MISLFLNELIVTRRTHCAGKGFSTGRSRPIASKNSNGHDLPYVRMLLAVGFLPGLMNLGEASPLSVDTPEASAYAPVRDFGGVAKW